MSLVSGSPSSRSSAPCIHRPPLPAVVLATRPPTYRRFLMPAGSSVGTARFPTSGTSMSGGQLLRPRNSRTESSTPQGPSFGKVALCSRTRRSVAAGRSSKSWPNRHERPCLGPKVPPEGHQPQGFVGHSSSGAGAGVHSGLGIKERKCPRRGVP